MPQKAKTARVTAQLSQGREASDVGINRSYLSQFESGKLLLDDATLIRLRDDSLLPQELDEDYADALLNEYAENRHRINNICTINLSNSGFLGFGIDEDKANKRVDEVFGLMAINYAIVEELQGHQIFHFNSKQASTGEKKVRDFVALRHKPYVVTSAIFKA